jgi:hypothetical protein
MSSVAPAVMVAACRLARMRELALLFSAHGPELSAAEGASRGSFAPLTGALRVALSESTPNAAYLPCHGIPDNTMDNSNPAGISRPGRPGVPSSPGPGNPPAAGPPGPRFHDHGSFVALGRDK